ncbi:MAG: LacI family transcriptional regulator [Tannerellaceae bacterium]|jgi:LacI family transcriptional regulator|nr:LacI family transcriptional regulator [Tannerellaceae bacterium]
MAQVSIKDIAQKVGVSNATVSLVLNGKEKGGRISAEVASRIREVAKELNYEPNNLARSLRVGKSRTIGLIIADISNNFFASLAFYIQEFAEKYEYAVIITNTNESSGKMGKMINVLKSRQVDGFIIVPTEDGEKHISELIASRIPVVLLDRYFPDLPVSHVIVNNYHASLDATNLLINLGCKNVALLMYDNQLPHMLERQKGYEEALKKANLFNPRLIKKINYSLITRDIPEAIDALLEEEQKVDGIFFATNSISMLGIKRLMELHITIPDDMKIVCFDKSDAFEFSNISIPYIQQPIKDLGRKAVDVLMELINQDTSTFTKIELFAHLLNVPE